MAMISLSFDDGRKDNYRVAMEMLYPMTIPATFNITSGYVLDVIDDKDKPGPHEPMDAEMVKQLFESDLFEIAGHGFTHDNEVSNLIKGVDSLRKICECGNIEMGVASPHSQFDLSILNKAKLNFSRSQISYLRISNDFSKMSFLKRCIRKINRVSKIPFLYYWVNKDSFITQDDFLLFSIPVIRDTSIKEVKYLIKMVEKKDLKCILMFHSVLKSNEPYYKDLFSWDYDDFHDLCEYIRIERDSGRLSVCCTKDLFK